MEIKALDDCLKQRLRGFPVTSEDEKTWQRGEVGCTL